VALQQVSPVPETIPDLPEKQQQTKISIQISFAIVRLCLLLYGFSGSWLSVYTLLGSVELSPWVRLVIFGVDLTTLLGPVSKFKSLYYLGIFWHILGIGIEYVQLNSDLRNKLQKFVEDQAQKIRKFLRIGEKFWKALKTIFGALAGLLFHPFWFYFVSCGLTCSIYRVFYGFWGVLASSLTVVCTLRFEMLLIFEFVYLLIYVLQVLGFLGDLLVVVVSSVAGAAAIQKTLGCVSLFFLFIYSCIIFIYALS